MIRFEMQASPTLSVLTLPGVLTGKHADTLAACLRSSLGNVRRLIIDCARVTDIDERCLAILCVAFRLSRQCGRQFILAGRVPPAIRGAAQELRGDHCAVCAPAGPGRCFGRERTGKSAIGPAAEGKDGAS